MLNAIKKILDDDLSLLLIQVLLFILLVRF